MKPVNITTSILGATVLGAALLTIGALGFSATTGEMSKLAYSGNLWCVSNWLDEENAGKRVYLSSPDGRPAPDHRLKGKEDWIRIDQVSAESKEEAEKLATRTGWFESSDKTALRDALDKGNKSFFTGHFNSNATSPGPCLGTGLGTGIIGKWVSDGINEECGFASAGSGSCEQVKSSIDRMATGIVNLPAAGRIVKEDHLITAEEGRFRPSSASDGIPHHLEVTKPYAKGITADIKVWTPAESGGTRGGGSGSPPPAKYEPWIMNMFWKSNSRPKEGTRFIIKSEKTGKSVVAIAGYETGPRDENRWLLGAQSEVLLALGVDSDAQVTLGLAKDQNLPAGPINCEEAAKPTAKNLPANCPQTQVKAGPAQGQDYRAQIAKAFEAQLSKLQAASQANFGDIASSETSFPPAFAGTNSEAGQAVVKAAQSQVGYKGNDDCTKYNAYEIDGSKCWAWCAAFVTWVYNQAGLKIERSGGTSRMEELFANGHKYISRPAAKGITPMPGDAFWMRSSASDSGYHVGIVESVKGNTVYTIEGNVTGDVVARRRHSLSEITALGRW